MVATDSTLYKRPLIVFLILSIGILFVFNYMPLILQREGFATASDAALPPTGYPATTCPPTTATFTVAETLTPMPSSMLPKTSEISRTAAGVLTKEATDTYIKRLIQEGRLPKELSATDAADADAVATYQAADRAALKAIADEACYIEARYKYCIKQFLDGAVKAATGSAPADYESWLTNARTLSTRQLDILTLIATLAKTRMAVYASSEAAAENASAVARINTLLVQKDDLDDPESAKKLYMKMVEFTKEKNKANLNLIGLYSFLNLVALGMLFYIYRAT